MMGWPINVLPSAMGMRALVLRHSSDSNKSRMMTLVFTAFGTSMPTELLPGTGARMLMRSALSTAAMLLFSAAIFSKLHAGARMQFVARDGRAFGDVAELHLECRIARASVA